MLLEMKFAPIIKSKLLYWMCLLKNNWVNPKSCYFPHTLSITPNSWGDNSGSFLQTADPLYKPITTFHHSDAENVSLCCWLNTYALDWYSLFAKDEQRYLLFKISIYFLFDHLPPSLNLFLLLHIFSVTRKWNTLSTLIKFNNYFRRSTETWINYFYDSLIFILFEELINFIFSVMLQLRK